MRYLLDTDHISFMDRNTAEGQRIKSRLAILPPLFVNVSIVTYEEQMRGWLSYVGQFRGMDNQVRNYEKLWKLLEFYCDTSILRFDEAAIEQFQNLWLQRIRISTPDLKIAAIALANDATVLTRNLKHFRMVPNLRSEDWTIEATA